MKERRGRRRKFGNKSWVWGGEGWGRGRKSTTNRVGKVGEGS